MKQNERLLFQEKKENKTPPSNVTAGTRSSGVFQCILKAWLALSFPLPPQPQLFKFTKPAPTPLTGELPSSYPLSNKALPAKYSLPAGEDQALLKITAHLFERYF